MTTAALIDVKLELDATRFKKGVNSATAAATNFQQRMKSVDAFLRTHTLAIAQLGEVFQQAGQRMTQFITIPIIGFLALVVKKAIDANTEMGKLAQGSLAKLSASLARLGEKFLPLFIKMVDWLTLMIDKFLAADPATQRFIAMLLAMAALAGPIVSFAGTLISITTTLGQLGVTLSSLIPALAALGTFVSGTLLPAIVALLPVLALVAAAALLVYLVWSNWETLKVTLEQLWFILKWGFWEVVNSITLGFKKGMEDIKARVKPMADFLKRVWVSIKTAFATAFSGIISIASRVFNAIRSAIMTVVSAISKVKAALASIKLPKALTPGSPTPFEVGLKGINEQMRVLSSQSIPAMNAGFKAAPVDIAAAGGGNGTYIDNRRFAAGVSPEAVKMALDDRTKQMTRALDRSR